MPLNRDPEIARLADGLRSFANPNEPPSAAAFLARIMEALEGDLPANPARQPTRPNVLKWLDPALEIARGQSPELAGVADAFAALAPRLHWGPRPGSEDVSKNFYENHANTVFVGHDGLAKHRDIRIGCSLVAPNIDYPTHQHPPEEAYLVLAGGDWSQHKGDWVAKGPGDAVHNPPMAFHAMRAKDTPLLAIWMLWVRTS
jgi:hypothetical protein